MGMLVNKKLLSNFLSLFTVKVVRYILPFITIPYLVRVLGPENYGLIAFSKAFVSYFILMIDYGFNLSAPRNIAIHRDDKEKVSDIFSSVIIIKTALMGLSFLGLYLLVFSFDRFKLEWLLYIVTFGMAFGNIMIPVWFFYGMERMKQVTILKINVSIIYTISIFIFIRSQNDYIYVPMIDSLSLIMTGFLSFWIIFKKFGIRLKIPPFISIKHELKEGLLIFISTISMSFYTISNTFILGVFTNNSIVGYYSAGENIVRVVLGLWDPLSQTIYPHISNLASESKEAALFFIRKMLKIISLASFFISLVLFIFAPLFSDIVLGEQFKASIPVIQILAFLPFIVGLSNIFGKQIMLNFGLEKLFMKTLVMAGVINIFLAIVLVLPLQHIGISISVLVTEIFITSYMFVGLRRNGLNVMQYRISTGVK